MRVCTQQKFSRLTRKHFMSMAVPLACIAMSSLVFAAEPPLTGPLPPGRVDPNDIIVNKRPAVPFQPFDLMDPKTKQRVAPNAIITLPSGKQVPAGQYYAELNRLEQGFNQLGYSLRDQPNRPAAQRKRVVPLQQNRLDSIQFKQQSDMITRDHVIPMNQQVPVPFDRMPQLSLQFQQGIQSSKSVDLIPGAQILSRSVEEAPSSEEIKTFRQYQEQAAKDKLLAERVEADRQLGIHVAESDYAEAAKEIEETINNQSTPSAGSQGTETIGEQDREAFTQWRDTQQRLSSAASPDGVSTRGTINLSALNLAAISGIRYQTSSQIHKNKGVNWSGGNTWFGAYVKGTTTLDGYPTMVSTHGDIDVGGTVVGASFSLLTGEGSVNVPQSGAMTATAKLSIVGTTVMNINKSQTVSWSESSSPARPFNKSTPPLTIWLGPIPLSVKAGIQGSSGMQYTVGFQPVRAYVSLGPTLNVNAYAQASIGADLILVEAQAGIRGTLVLIKENMIGQADAGLVLVNGALVYQTTFAIYNDLRMLDGSLVAFASIEHPCVPDFWNSCEDEWDHTLFSWSGIHATGYLVNEVGSVSVYARPSAIMTK